MVYGMKARRDLAGEMRCRKAAEWLGLRVDRAEASERSPIQTTNRLSIAETLGWFNIAGFSIAFS